METQKRVNAIEPRFEQGRFQLIAGFGARFTQDTAQDTAQAPAEAGSQASPGGATGRHALNASLLDS